MKKRITLLVLLVIVVGSGLATLSYFTSFKTAHVHIERSGVSVNIYNAADKQVGTLPGSGSLSLREGSYHVVPYGQNIATDPLPLRVTSRGAYLAIDPGYSKAYLHTLLVQELPAISSVISTAYPSVLPGFTVNTGSLYRYGGWYATTLAQASPGPGANGDVYRTVLEKQNGSWKIVAPPALVLSAKDYPSVPRSVLSNINAQSGY